MNKYKKPKSMQIKGKLSGKALLLALLAQAIFLVLATAPTTFAAGAREYENPPCYDVTGTTQAVAVGGVNNGGLMDFDDAGVPAAQAACVRMKADKVTPDRLEGWVWDSNLGWVSLYCPGGAGAKNLDIVCGSQAYSVTFAATGGTAPNFTSVPMSGYAWGDNIGWISFNSGFHQMKPTASGSNRGLVPVAPAADRYSWSDAIGWQDWSGVWFHWEDTDPPATDPNVIKYISVCSSKDPLPPGTLTDPKCTCDLDSTCPIAIDPTKIPDANNTDVYDIKIPFVDAGAAVPSSKIDACPAVGSINMYTMKSGVADYCAKIALQWEDDVDYDQTTAASQTQATPKFNATNTGAVTKPLNYALSGGDFTYDGVNTLWGAKVRSYAPTSERNVTQGMQNEKFYYSDISSGYDTTKSSQNLLKLKGINLLFFKYSTSLGTPGTCIYGTINGSNCDMRNYMATDTTLSFNPLANVTALTNTVGSQQLNFISIASPDNPVMFHYQGVGSGFDVGTGKTEGYLGLQSGGSGNYRLKFVSSFPTDPASEPSPGNYFQNSGANGTADLTGQLFSDSGGSTLDANAGPFLYTTETYNVGTKAVKYFSSKLPRIKAGLLLNPVAKVEGNVYVTDFGQKASDVTLHSLGNISSNLRREAVVRNVAKYLNGLSGSPVSGNVTVNTGTTASITGLTTLVSDANRKVFYLNTGNLTIDCGATCAFDTNTTFIVENGNIYVNSNIVPTGNNQVGLIALRDLVNNKRDQGMLFIDGGVTWLSGVQIYLDRVVQSYDKTVAVAMDANGFIKYSEDDYARQGRFKNQLVFEGTISSMNGIGNASRSPATDENGSPLAAGTFCSSYATLTGICRARVVDLNYQRYYGPGLEICQGSEGAGAVAGVPRDQALKTSTGNGCDPTNVAYDIDASQLYDPVNYPNADLIAGAGSGTRSQYFVTKGLPAIVANEFPVNFFYKPISKNLAGFEVDTNINPLIQN